MMAFIILAWMYEQHNIPKKSISDSDDFLQKKLYIVVRFCFLIVVDYIRIKVVNCITCFVTIRNKQPRST